MEATLQTRAKSPKFAIRSCYQSRTAEINGDLRAAAETNRYLQLPEEVLEDILLRLPAETLKNCKRVCKSLFDLINNPSFVNKHLLRVTTENGRPCSSSSRTLFLKWIRQELSMDDIFGGYHVYHPHGNDLSKLVLSMVTICEDDTNGNRDDDRLSCVVEEVRLPPIPESELPYFPTYIKASSHSNGIIHMADPENEGTSVLLNPILGEFKLLIRPEDLPDDYYYKFTGDDLTLHGLAGWGFGYDPKAKVYKCG